jgi:hypothetical protein
MNHLTQTLLGSVAMTALAAVPSNAKPAHPAMHVTALHAGKQVNKTKFHVPGATHLTYTFGVYSTLPASSVGAHVAGTFYKWNSQNASGYYTLCSNPKQKLKTPKKTVFGSTKADTETYSLGCPSGPTVFHGDDWTNVSGVAGDVDTWVSTLKGKWKSKANGVKYKATLNLDVTLNID